MPRAYGKKKSAKSSAERDTRQLSGDKHTGTPELPHERRGPRKCQSVDAQGSSPASESAGPNKPKAHATQAGSCTTQAGSCMTQAGPSATQMGSTTTQVGPSTTKARPSTIQVGSTASTGPSTVQPTRKSQTTDSPNRQTSNPKACEYPHITPISELAFLLHFPKHLPGGNTDTEINALRAQLHSVQDGSSPQTGSSTPQTGSSTPQTGSSTPQAGSSTPQAGSSTPQASSSTPQTGSSTPQTGSSTPQTGSSTPQTGSSTPQTGSSTPQTGSSTPQTGSSAPQASSCTQVSSFFHVGPLIQPANQPHTTSNPDRPQTPTAQPHTTSNPDHPQTPTAQPHGHTHTCGHPHTCPEKERALLLDFSHLRLADDDNTHADYVDYLAQLDQRYKQLEVDLLNEIKQETLKVKFSFTDEEVNREIKLCKIKDAEKAKGQQGRSSQSPADTGQQTTEKQTGGTTERQQTASTASPNNKSKRNTQKHRRPSVGDIIGNTIDSLYAESDESNTKNSIITLNNLDSSYFYILDSELQEMIKWKYQSIMKTDAYMDKLDVFMKIVKEVRLGLSNHEDEDDDKAEFVFRFIKATGYHSVEDLEETLEAHKKFRIFLEDLTASSSQVEQPMGNVERVLPDRLCLSNSAQTPIRQDSGSVQSPDQTGKGACSKASTATPDFQPFLGDSAVRPKVSKPRFLEKSPKESKFDKKDQYDPEKKKDVGSNVSGQYKPRGVRILQQSTSPELKRPGIGYGSKFQLHTVASSKTEKWESADESKSVQDVNFDNDLEAIYGEAEDCAGDDYFVILAGIKDNFELAELLQCVLSGNAEPLSRRTLRLPPQKIVDLLACFANITEDVNPAECTNEASSTALSGDSSDASTGANRSVPEEVAPPTGIAVTWQSRVRAFYKRTVMNKPLEERLGSKPKVTKLTEFLCPKCRERHRWPHVLYCCHRFCFPCVVKLYQKDRNCFTCPICLCYSLPPCTSNFGPQSFTIDYIFAGEMFEANLSPFCCTNCDSSEDAVKFCTECLVYMCQECCLHHCQTKPTSQHKLENTDVKIGAASDGRIVALCIKHPGQSYSKFCKMCWTGVCAVCLQRNHKSHEILEMCEILGMVRQQLNSNNAQILELSKGFQKLLMNLKQSKQDIEALHRAGRHIINKVSYRLHANLEVLRATSREEVRIIFENIRQQCAKAEAERKVFMEELEAFREFVNRYLYFAHPEDTVMMFPVIKMRHDYLEKKRSSNPYLRQRFDFDIRFQPQYPEVTNAIQELFAALEFEYTSYLNRTLLDSKFVRDRHYVEPYKPPPYSLDYRYQSEIAEKETQQTHVTAVGAVSDPNDGIETINFLRQTLPYSRAFGRYGRGDYEFAEPSGVLYLHDCSLAVCDTRNHRILIYREDGAHLRTIGQPTVIPDLPPLAEEADKTFPRTVGKLYFPYRLAQCPITRNIIILERPPSLSIQIFSFDGRFIRSFGNPHLQSPRGITVDERGLILILESKTMNFFIFTQDGELIQKSVLGALEFPNDVVARAGTIYISDNRNHCVKTFDYSLNYKKTFGNESLTYYPISVGFNGQDFMVVTDNHNTFNITVFGKTGLVLAGFKSRARHANCYNVALHPTRPELAVTTKEYQVLIFNYDFNPDGTEPGQ